MNAAVALAALAARRGWGARPAYHCDGRTWTHAQVHDLAARAADELRRRGVRPGLRVLLAMPDGIGWVVSFLAVARLGAVSVLVDPALSAAEHRHMAVDSAAQLAIIQTDDGRFDGVAAVLPVDRLLAATVIAIPAAARLVPDSDPLYVQYTSGTSGAPKGVVHRHGDLATYAAAVGWRVLGLRCADVGLSMTGLYCAYGLGNSLAFPLCTGSSVVLLGDRRCPGDVHEAAARYGVTVLYGVPSAYADLLRDRRSEAFGPVRVAVSAGAALPTPLATRTAAYLGAPVLDQIGSTAVGNSFCANSIHHNEPGTVGRPVPGYQLEVRDDGGRVLGDDTEGQLWVHGPSAMIEFLGRPRETAETLVDGWIATHDRAVRQPDGTYLHRGREDDVEVVSGVSVSPLEIEALMRTHPSVRDVAVAAVPDLAGTSVLQAFVVADGSDPRLDDLPRELICLARGRLSGHAVPRSVRLVSDLPRTSTGRLCRRVVRDGAW